MKKILLCGILALAAGGMAFGQWPDGFSVTGQLYTGLRADFVGGDWYTDKNSPAYLSEYERASFGFWNTDTEQNRVQLTMRYEQENYGFAFRPRFLFADSGTADVHYAYGWFELMNDMIRVTAGKINNAQWYSPDTIERHYSNGYFRIEVKPIDGLNFGWALGNRDYAFPESDISYAPGGLVGKIGDVFAASSFGAKYTSDVFTFAAGLELRPAGANRRTNGDDFLAALTSGSSLGGGTVAAGKTAMNAYAGLMVNPVDGLTIKAGVDSGNLDIADETGYIWLDQYLEYSLGSVTPRIELHQIMDISKTSPGKWTSPDSDSVDQTPVYMEFIPGVDFDISDNLSGYVDIPVKLLDKQLEIGVKPGVIYNFGPGLEIGCFYRLAISNADYEIYDNKGKAINNAVQINFAWSF